MLAGSGADSSLELRVREIGESLELARLHTVPGCQGETCPGRETEPKTVGVTQVSRDRVIENGGVHGFEEVGLAKRIESTDVDGEHGVGRVVVAGRLDLLHHPLLREHDVHLDAGLPGELLEHGLDQEWLAVRVQVDLARRVGRRKRERRCESESRQVEERDDGLAHESGLRILK